MIEAGHKPGRRQVAQAVADAVDLVPNVHRYEGVQASTLIPGGRVDGVRVGESEVTVHVVVSVAFGHSFGTTGSAVGGAAEAAIASLGDSRSVAIVIEDFTPAPDGSERRKI